MILGVNGGLILPPGLFGLYVGLDHNLGIQLCSHILLIGHHAFGLYILFFCRCFFRRSFFLSRCLLFRSRFLFYHSFLIRCTLFTLGHHCSAGNQS